MSVQKDLQICDNCESAVANWRCSDCEKGMTSEAISFSHFCSECACLHRMLRQFKTHHLENTLTLFQTRKKKCCNCEESVCKFFCKDCDEVNRYLCLGCSIMHPKIKSFRNHRVLVIDNHHATLLPESINQSSIKDYLVELYRHFSSSFLTFFKSSSEISPTMFSRPSVSFISLIALQLFFSRLLEEVQRCSFRRYSFWRSLLILLVLTSCYYITVKQKFGRHSVSVHMLVILGILLSNYYHQSEQKKQQKAIFSQSIQNNQSIVKQSQSKGKYLGEETFKNLANEFPDEFSYEKKPSSTNPVQGKKVSFRPRTRAYVPRSKSHKKDSEAVAVEDSHVEMDE